MVMNLWPQWMTSSDSPYLYVCYIVFVQCIAAIEPSSCNRSKHFYAKWIMVFGKILGETYQLNDLIANYPRSRTVDSTVQY
jgi:hypothetical protein